MAVQLLKDDKKHTNHSSVLTKEWLTESLYIYFFSHKNGAAVPDLHHALPKQSLLFE